MKLVLRALVGALTLTLAAILLPAPAQAVPVYGSWQNIPKRAGGKPAQQYATLNQIARLVDQAPKGSTITVSMYSQNRYDKHGQPGASVLKRMERAVKRGVHLRYVTFGQGNSPEFRRLARAVKRKHDRLSWTKVCSGACRLNNRKGRGKAIGLNHLKALTFTQTGGRRAVSLIMSGNLTRSGAEGQWNNHQVLLDPVIFSCLTRHIVSMRADRWQGAPKGCRSRNGVLTLYLFPQPKKPQDPFLRELHRMKCRWTTGPKRHRVKHRGTVLLDMAFFSGNRNSFTRELGRKRRQGCTVYAIVTRGAYKGHPALTSDPVMRQLRRDKVPTWDSWVRGNKGGWYSHNKRMSLYGNFGSKRHPRPAGESLTGSGNMTKAGQRSNDDAILLWKSTAIYQAGVRQWVQVRKHSRRIV